MKYSYRITYSFDKDIWNWYYGTKYSNNSQQLNGVDFAMAKKILKFNKRESEKILRPFLRQKLEDKNSQVNQFVEIAEQEFVEKFVPACEILAKTS